MINKKIGILGGTFDPVHNGHLSLAEGVKERMGLEEVLFVPSGIPPHKKDREVTPARHRLAMVKLAIEGREDFSLSELEVERQGYSYTVDTLKELRRIYHEKSGTIPDFYFIIGADVVPELTTWRNYQEVFALCNFAAVLRPGYDRGFFKRDVDRMRRLGSKIFPVEIATADVSSSEIRRMIAEGKDVTGLLPEKVYNYIREMGLYR